MLTPSQAFDQVIRLAETTRLHGGRTLMIGGCVRDGLIDAEPKDIDVEVYGIAPEKLESVLGRAAPHVIQVGRSFPVWKIWADGMPEAAAIDVAIPRRERKTGECHTDFEAQADPFMSPTEASSRRDFTINTISYDPLTGELLDPFGGARDLENRILRHVSPRFAEDPLRVLRGMQFCSRFDLTPAPQTAEFCRTLSAEHLSSERIFGEVSKLILKGKTPSRGLAFLAETGWDRHFPEVAALKGVPQNPRHHPEGDAWKHTGHCLDAFAKRRPADDDKALRVGLAVLLHDVGKATHTQIQPDGKITSYGHDIAGAKPAGEFLRRITDQSRLLSAVPALVTDHMLHYDIFHAAKRDKNPAAMDRAVRRLSLHLGRNGTTLDELCLVCSCDHAGRPPLPEHCESVDWLRGRAEHIAILENQPKPMLMGRDLIGLCLQPGVAFKALLAEAFERQMEGQITDAAGALSFAREYITAHPELGPGVLPIRMPRPPPEHGADATLDHSFG